MIVTPAGGTAIPVTATTWTNGVSLGTDIPVGKSAGSVHYESDRDSGASLARWDYHQWELQWCLCFEYRVKDNDQAIVTPTAEGFISVPLQFWSGWGSGNNSTA